MTEAEVRAELTRLDKQAVEGRGDFDKRNTRRRELWAELRKMLRGRQSSLSSFQGGGAQVEGVPPAPEAAP